MDSRHTLSDPPDASLSSFHPIIARWFQETIGSPTNVQTASWPAIRSGEHALIAAPTGSGKTLAAFLASIDSLFQQALSNDLADHTQILYVSPLKALSNDVQKNLRQPLNQISENALAAGLLLRRYESKSVRAIRPQRIDRTCFAARPIFSSRRPNPFSCY